MIFAFAISSIHCARVPVLFNKRRQIKDMHIAKEEVKLPLFTDDMIIYVENLTEYTNKNHFIYKSRQLGYKLLFSDLIF